jgi:PAS domain S-box-containing protein
MRSAARYAIALVSIGIALALTMALPELLAPMRLFFLWVAVLITALIGGTGPGLLAAALALTGAAWLVFTPAGVLRIDSGADVLRLALFASFASGISIAVGRTKQLSAALRASELRYRTIVESTPAAQAVWTATPEGRITWAPRWAEMTGQSFEELQAGGGMNRVHPDDAARTRKRWSEALASGALFEDLVRMRVASGRYRWFAIKASPVRDRGSIIEWVGITADVHDRKVDEENAAFINRASDLLSSTLASQQAMRHLARLCVPALGDSCAICVGHDEHYERVVAEHEDATRPLIPDHDAIVEVLRSGRVKWSELSVLAPMVARGRTLGALAVACGDGRRYEEEDLPLIEELARRAATALDNARLFEAAEGANRAKDEFLATLSHELRTPLTAISGWAHMLESGISDDETRRLAIETIVRSANTQRELIDDLLDLSRVVAGTLHLDIRTIDMVTIVQDAIVSARPAADAKHVALSIETPPLPVLVRGDERRLRQIVWNLVTNAVKFTDRDGSATLRVTAAGSMARIEVSDTGRGIDAAFLPHVWDRFRQADSSTSRQFGGLGLGLAVVRHLAEMHGGTVHAESAGLGRGATFRVEIPLAPTEDGGRAVTTASDEAAAMRGRRILVVDDDDDARLVVATLLAHLGADVSPAGSVDEALRLLATQPFDAIVSDIAMPGQDGYSLVSQTHSRVPAVAVSAISTGPEDRRRALESGFADFVRKPVDPQELARAVISVLSVQAD